MTRFARAKGSKSSNERAPEDGTPWEVMKDQLLKAKQDTEYSKKRQEAEQQRIENYENFLKEQKIQKRKATWCDFPEVSSKKKPSEQHNKLERKSEKYLSGKELSTEQSDTIPKNKKKKKQKHDIDVQNESNVTESTSQNPREKVSKKKNKKKNKTIVTEQQGDTQNEATITGNTSQNFTETSLKKKKNKPADQEQNVSEVNNSNKESPTQNENNNNKSNTKTKKDKKIKFKGQNQKVADNPNMNNKGDDNHNNSNFPKKQKNKKLLNGQPNRRKPINDNSFQLVINGKEVNLVRYDGFPIMEKDADRLNDLRNNMIKKGIPKSEIQRTMKLERRRAEKALARLKRDVCYNCRKGGHNLSDCPDLKSKIPGVDAADGICFKCGSTEHKQFECKVQRDKEFRFASCFICKEQGHIARQCPDNPKGLYPNGGGCNLCGDVTHLKKDCPTVQDKREGKSIKLNTLDNTDNLEDIDQQPQMKIQETTKAPKKIRF